MTEAEVIWSFFKRREFYSAIQDSSASKTLERLMEQILGCTPPLGLTEPDRTGSLGEQPFLKLLQEL